MNTWTVAGVWCENIFVINQNWRLVLRITDEIESTTNLFGVIVFYFSSIRYIYRIFFLAHSLSLSIFTYFNEIHSFTAMCILWADLLVYASISTVCISCIHNSFRLRWTAEPFEEAGHMCVSYILDHKAQTNYVKANVRASYLFVLLAINVCTQQ